jgi:hypothetical protein
MDPTYLGVNLQAIKKKKKIMNSLRGAEIVKHVSIFTKRNPCQILQFSKTLMRNSKFSTAVYRVYMCHCTSRY